MPDPRTDQIAREAARLMETGRIDDIADAIHVAAGSLGLRTAPMPGLARVRKHAQAMAMQALGEREYRLRQRKVWEIAEQVMAVFEHSIPDAQTLLVGRAAHGHINAGVTVHIRLYTRASVEDIARWLVEYGYDEPTFRTAEARHSGGRLNQICLVEGDLEIVVTRCIPPTPADASVDFFTGKPIETIGLSALRQRLDQSERADNDDRRV
jgi:hypothetical protein